MVQNVTSRVVVGRRPKAVCRDPLLGGLARQVARPRNNGEDQMTAAQQTITEFPSLVEHLTRDGFALTPNYARPLSNRIVEERFDPASGQTRPVTEREYVER